MRKRFSTGLLFGVMGLMLMSLAGTVNAQSSPGGISNGLVFWLKADAGVVKDATNTSVTTWQDQSPTKADVTQTSSACLPVLAPNVLKNGTLPVMRFAKGKYLERTDGLGFSGSPDMTVIVYANAVTSSSNYTMMSLGPKPGANAGKSAQFTAEASIRYSDGRIQFWRGGLANGFHTGTFIHPAGSYYHGANSSITYYKDGTQVTTDGNTGTAKNWALTNAGTMVGGARANTDVNPTLLYAGDIAEIIIYNRVLPTAERTAVEDYLKTKYADTPASPAISVNPTAVTFANVNVVTSPNGATTSTVTITNNGTAPLNFLAQTGQTTNPGLVLTGDAKVTIDSVTPATSNPLAVGQSLKVVLRFQPGAAGFVEGGNNRHQATLTLYTNDPTTPALDVPILGVAVPVEMSRFATE